MNRISSANPVSLARRCHGFTLVELLAVIGIIAVLLSIALPSISAIRRSAERSSVKLDLSAIAQALEAYRADFKEYPKVNTWWLGYCDSGRLGVYLISPGPGGRDPTTGLAGDGCDGPGFALVPAVWNAQKNGWITSGQVYGPYLKPDRFPLDTEVLDFPWGGEKKYLAVYLKDRYGGRISYYPVNQNISPTIDLVGYDLACLNATDGAMEDADDEPNRNALRWSVGDRDRSNKIDGNERLRYSGGFILMSLGPDGKFGPIDPKTGSIDFDSGVCDDVWSFD